MSEDSINMKEIKQAVKRVAICESCQFYETDGEHGEIESCCHDAMDYLNHEEAKFLMQDSTKCPFWKASSIMDSGFCTKHDKLYILSEISCDVCWEEHMNKMIKVTK